MRRKKTAVIFRYRVNDDGSNEVTALFPEVPSRTPPTAYDPHSCDAYQAIQRPTSGHPAANV